MVLGSTIPLFWKDIPFYPDYQVSITGKLRSLKRKEPKLLKTRLDKDGYYRNIGKILENIFRRLACRVSNPYIISKTSNAYGNKNNRIK